MFLIKYKPRRCQFKQCRKVFKPETGWQKYCCVLHRETEKRWRRQRLMRKAQRILDAQEKERSARA